jgi:hypothetical protein
MVTSNPIDPSNLIEWFGKTLMYGVVNNQVFFLFSYELIIKLCGILWSLMPEKYKK